MTRERVHVITTDSRRGAEVRAAELVAALRATGAPDRLVALRSTAAAATVDAERLRDGATRHPATLLALRRRSREAGVIIGHGGDTLSACALADIGLGIPFVYETVGDPAFWRDRWAAARRARLLLSRSTAVVALFPKAVDALIGEGVPRERIHLIPSGISPEEFRCVDDQARARARRRLGLATEQPVVAVVGALSPEKDPLAALRACPPQAQLVFAGGGPLLKAVRDASARDGDRVRLLGPTDDVQTVYAAADVVVLSSRTEGLPGVAIEAALAGVPMVATDVGGTGAVVRHGETGLLVPPGDARALAAAIAEALARSDLGGERARRWAIERYSLSAWVTAWDELLRSVARP